MVAMRRYVYCIAAFAGLTGCQPAQVTLSVAPAFYPSAIAHDPAYDRYFVASYASGEIISVRRDGTRVATVRQPGTPVLQVSYDRKSRRLWALTPHAVESIELLPAPPRRTPIAAGNASARYADLVSDSGERAYALDLAARAVVEIDAVRRSTRILARLPATGDADAPHCSTAPASAALLLLDDRATVLAAVDGRLWRIDRNRGEVEEIRLRAPLPDVSQLLLLDSNEASFRIAALRGRANEVVTIRLAHDARHAMIDAGTRVRYDTPLHGAFDGRQLVVLLGRLRHHPDFCGDGRPNLPARLAIYSPYAPSEGLAVARAAGR